MIKPKVDIIFQKNEKRLNKTSTKFVTQFNYSGMKNALLWFLNKDKYVATAPSLAKFMTENGFKVTDRTIRNWRKKFNTPELLWQNLSGRALQLIVEAFDSTRDITKGNPIDPQQKIRETFEKPTQKQIPKSNVQVAKEATPYLADAAITEALVSSGILSSDGSPAKKSTKRRTSTKNNKKPLNNLKENLSTPEVETKDKTTKNTKDDKSSTEDDYMAAALGAAMKGF